MIERFIVWVFATFILNVIWAALFASLWLLVGLLFGANVVWVEAFRTLFWVFLVLDVLRDLWNLSSKIDNDSYF